MHRVQIFMRVPFERAAHWRFGYLREFPVGLNFVARTRLLYFPATNVPFAQIGHTLAIVLWYDSITRKKIMQPR